MDSTMLIGGFAIFHYPLLRYRKGQSITIPEDAVAALVYNGDVQRALWPGDQVRVPRGWQEKGRTVLWLMRRSPFVVQIENERGHFRLQLEVVDAFKLAVAVLDGQFSQGNVLQSTCDRACNAAGITVESIAEIVSIKAEKIGIQCLKAWRV